jgi:ubiquinol-cytochrome c reductase cytochrome b subunit
MRQIHHWTALAFISAIVLHVCRVFFTGAFRKPRELNWVIGWGLLLLALGEGFTGYSLPDDLLSGTGLRIAYSAVLSIPFLGPWLAFLLFGGEFPTDALLSRLFVLHVMLLPGILIGGIAAHVGLTFIQKHTQFRGRGATERNVVGTRFWPVQTFRSLGLFFLTAATLALLGGLFQINPIWTYGPFVPYVATVPSQPDWYLGWLEGALRLGPSFEPTILGVTIPTPFIPGVLIPGALFTLLIAWPFLEARFTRDDRAHHLLDMPWQAPVRTATGLAILSFFLVETVAGGNDVISVFLNVQIETLTSIFRVLLVALPVGVWLVAFTICRDRQRAHRLGDPEPPLGRRLVRTADGGFEEAAE